MQYFIIIQPTSLLTTNSSKCSGDAYVWKTLFGGTEPSRSLYLFLSQRESMSLPCFGLDYKESSELILVTVALRLHR